MSAAGKKDKQAKQLPVLDKSKANDMNMMVLKRIDSQIEEVIASAAHVCLYRMSVNEQQWQRKNIEGSLFLIKRRTQPRFQMLVLNKLSTDNYIETVHGGLEMETNPPYLMYTHGNDEIHGIWFYDENDLHHLAGLLQKVLNQLPKPDESAALQPQQQHYQPAAAPVAQETPQPAPHTPAGGADGFWDRSVHVTEETLPATQQLVPNSSLLTESSGTMGNAAGATGAGGLQGLLMAAQQKHNVAQRASSAHAPVAPTAAVAAAAQLPAPAPAAVPVPNSTSMPSEPAAAPPAATLLTPAFFEQQKAKQQQQAVSPAAAVPAAAGPSSSSSAAAVVQQPAPVAPQATNGASPGGSALHQLLSRAAKHTPSGPTPASSGAAAGNVRSHPQPPIGVLSQEAVRDKVKAALIRLANNDAFVDMLAQEMKTVGLIQ